MASEKEGGECCPFSDELLETVRAPLDCDRTICLTRSACLDRAVYHRKVVGGISAMEGHPFGAPGAPGRDVDGFSVDDYGHWVISRVRNFTVPGLAKAAYDDTFGPGSFENHAVDQVESCDGGLALH